MPISSPKWVATRSMAERMPHRRPLMAVFGDLAVAGGLAVPPPWRPPGGSDAPAAIASLPHSVHACGPPALAAHSTTRLRSRRSGSRWPGSGAHSVMPLSPD